MTQSAAKRLSERRSEHLLNELLQAQGWDLRRPPTGDVLLQHEYRYFSELAECLSHASKTGKGPGIPEAILVDRETLVPLAVIETKPTSKQYQAALIEAQTYAEALSIDSWRPLAIGLAGTDSDDFILRVAKRADKIWTSITYDQNPIGWIPTRADLDRIAAPTGPTEIRPSIPPLEVLAGYADEINRLLREARISDAFRPAVVAAIMLALWHSRGDIRRDKRYILKDVNSACQEAYIQTGKADLAKSVRVDEANAKLRNKSRRIVQILERLNVTVLTAEHDYLGQLYETFFRYTGGNTIGQYFTPRHITRMMADVCEVTRDDIVLDPACGTGGFLVACMDRILTEHSLSREQMVNIVQHQLVGFEDEPVTAALCVANMILRGDGSTRVHHGDALTSMNYPEGSATIALMNPPFPHAKTDTPVEAFIERALDGLADRGKLAAIVPMSLLVKRSKGSWRTKILQKNSLLAVCQLPDELFQPFASVTTAFVVLEKGVPHNRRRKTEFVRLRHDGLVLRKGARVDRSTEPNQILEAIEVIVNPRSTPGFCQATTIGGEDEWAPGAYIESTPPEVDEIREAVDVHLRRLGSFYARYAREIVVQRHAIASGDLVVRPYRTLVSDRRLKNATANSSTPGTIGAMFDIYYGMKELHSREGYAEGTTLVISPTGEYNGCYGWLEFSKLIKAPFVTVAQTGNIGEAFVQLEPCAVNDDCLILVAKNDADVMLPDLVLAAATLHSEKWRFTYGRKLTPSRIAGLQLPEPIQWREWIAEKMTAIKGVIEASVGPYEEEAEVEQDRIAAKMRLS